MIFWPKNALSLVNKISSPLIQSDIHGYIALHNPTLEYMQQMIKENMCITCHPLLNLLSRLCVIDEGMEFTSAMIETAVLRSRLRIGYSQSLVLSI